MLEAPAGPEIRPTADRARQALFNILEHGAFAVAGGPPFIGRHVVDVFAGTGALGLEALSRGAAHASFIELEPRLLTANIARLGEAAHGTVIRGDATRPPVATQPCAVAFLDPPYHRDLGAPSLIALRRQGWLTEGSLAVLEISAKEAFSAPDGFALADSRLYGAARLLFLNVTEV